MKTTDFLGQECIVLENNSLQLLITRSVGPRILSLRFQKGQNLFAELPVFVTERPDGIPYHFYGGHRLWISPEHPLRSYALDDQAVDISRVGDAGILVRKAVEPGTGIEKSILLELQPDKPMLAITHRLANRGSRPVECAPWAITQFRTGGVAVLPQARVQTGLLPNRLLSFWPYADISSPCLSLGNDFILIRAGLQAPFKIGFPNPRGWLAYWLDGVLFVKRAGYDPGGNYSDFGSSSECYCDQRFLELETLAPLSQIEPYESVAHMETWELYPGVPIPENEHTARMIVNEIGLE